MPTHIAELAKERWEAKIAKDYEKADELRNQLTEAGREMRESKEGYELTLL